MLHCKTEIRKKDKRKGRKNYSNPAQILQIVPASHLNLLSEE